MKDKNFNVAKWKSELEKIEKCPQRQDNLTAQCIDLISIANRFGFYDAADFLKNNFQKK